MKSKILYLLGISLLMGWATNAMAFDVPKDWDDSKANYVTLPMGDSDNLDFVNNGICAPIDGVTKRNGTLGDGGNDKIGSTGYGTNVYFYLDNTKEDAYILTFKSGTSQDPCKLRLMIINENGDVFLDKTETLSKTGAWTPSEIHEMTTDKLPVGKYRFSMTVTECTSSYAGNWGSFHFAEASSFVDPAPHIPGNIPASDLNCFGGARLGSNGEVGYIVNGSGVNFDAIADVAGVYSMAMPTMVISGGQVLVEVTDKATGILEASTLREIPAGASMDNPAVYVFDNEITSGKKNIRVTFINAGGYVCNVQAPSFAKVAEKVARLVSFDVPGQEVMKHDVYDWNVNLPLDYKESTVVFNAPVQHGTMAVTANGIEVTDLGNGKYSIPAPAANEEVVLTMTVTKEESEGTIINKSVWTARIFHIGDVIISGVTLDDMPLSNDVVTAFNAKDGKAVINDFTFTTVPQLKATFLDGSVVTAEGTISGDAIEYSFTGKVGDVSKNYTLSAKTVHIYTKGAADESVEIKWTTAGADGNWTDGSYTFVGSNDGYQTSFKIGPGEKTLKIPADIVVKQMIFRDLRNNYNEPGAVTSASSGDATVYLPTINRFYHGDKKIIDMPVNFENHKAGEPINFTFTGAGQMMCWIELVVERQALTGSPVLKNISTTQTEGVNHFVVKAEYDREISKAAAVVNGQTVEAEGGSSILYFPVWNLDYDKEYLFTLAAGAVEDRYGNKSDKDETLKVKTGVKTAVAKAGIDYVVSNVEEFKAALAAVNASNKSAEASRKVIFVKNGDYDFGAVEQTFRTHNVSVVGESRDGVVLHGLRDGISNPIISTRYATDTYLQDMTLRNDIDFDKQSRVGVGVALYSGMREIGVNLSLQSQQDTQVTGEQGYYVGCDIYGSVDFICGGGNQFYDRCNLIITNSGHITAPSTSVATKWGYVFSNCTVDAYKGSYDAKVDGAYTLGRPWQNEPRAYYLNTVMNIKPTDVGWGNMGNLPTHFYEYASVDAGGNLIDLSVRGNSGTHTGAPYKPVLTDEEAARFTVENVLGYQDSYLPTEHAAQLAAPAVTLNGSKLEWADNADARFYVIFKDGAYFANTTENNFVASEAGVYTVKCANERGGLGAASNAVDTNVGSGIHSVESETNVSGQAYNLVGQKVPASQKGILIINGKKIVK